MDPLLKRNLGRAIGRFALNLLADLVDRRLPDTKSPEILPTPAAAPTQIAQVDEASVPDMLLEEYKSLRQESLTAMQNQHASIRYSITAFGILFGFAFTQMGSAWDDLIFLLAIPGFSALSYGFLAIEVSRMIRVGRYIEHLEVTCFPKANRHAPRWETWLSTERRKGDTPRLQLYILVPGFYFGVVVMSIALYLWGPCFSAYPCSAALLGQATIVGGLWTTIIVAISIRLQTTRQLYSRFLQDWRTDHE